MAKFQKNQPKPVRSGIKKGQKQTKTLVRQRVETALLNNNVDLVELLLSELDKIAKPEAKASVILKLMEFAYPKLSAQSVSIDDQRDNSDEDTIDVTPVSDEELIKTAKEGANE